MHKFRFAVLFFIGLIAFPAMAQDEKEAPQEDPKNLVPNPSFETYEGSLRRGEQFELVTGWSNPTPVKSEIFASGVKSKYVAIPENMYGNESAADGDNYAGLVAFSPRSKVPRSYLSVKLKEKMKEKSLYCVKFQASLAERSRVASNNLGVVFEKSAMKESTAGTINRTTMLSPVINNVVKTTDGWWEYCATYAAKGGEQYLTIGNFASDDRTLSENMELPSQYEEAGSVNAAYYYIDAVVVEAQEGGKDCGCSNTKAPESKIIYSGSVAINENMTLGEKLDVVEAYFYQYKDDVVSSAERNIDQVIELMNQNPLLKVQIVGHTDNEEAERVKTDAKLSNLGLQRAKNTMNYMTSKGIDRSRLSAVTVDNTQPASTMKTPISLAKNRRVEFKINL